MANSTPEPLPTVVARLDRAAEIAAAALLGDRNWSTDVALLSVLVCIDRSIQDLHRLEAVLR